MNFSSLIGILIGAAVLWFGVIGHSVHPEIFLDSHALLLVFGGTLAAGLCAFPISKFQELLQFLVLAVKSQEKMRTKIGREIVDLASVDVQVKPMALSHPLLLEGFELLKKSVPAEDFKRILLQKNHRIRDQFLSDARTLTALAKFPPAFGLLGATTGMISMLTGLSATGQNTIGPSMAVALVATFWGIALANFVLLPMADRAAKMSADESQLRTMVVTSLVLINQGSSRDTIIEYVASFLTPRERVNSDWLKNNVSFLQKIKKPSMPALPK